MPTRAELLHDTRFQRVIIPLIELLFLFRKLKMQR